ncbi:MAG: glycosyltransferase family 4 protein [Candidatus Binatia bacterium]
MAVRVLEWTSRITRSAVDKRPFARVAMVIAPRSSLREESPQQYAARAAPAAWSPLHIVLLDYRDIRHPEAGGAEQYLNEIFQRVAAYGHRVTLLSARYPGAKAEDRIGRIRVLRAGNTATANFTGARAALALARRERVDVFVESICKLPFLLPVLTKIPVVPVVHHLFGRTIFYQLNPLVAAYAWLYEKLIPSCYRGLRFVAVSQSTAEDLASRGVRLSRMDIVYNCVDFDTYGLPAGSTQRSDAPLLLYVGRFRRYKQIDIVIRAFARARQALPAARLALVGKGDDEPRLRALVRSLGVSDAVSFVGYVSEAEKIRWLHRAHALVYPSPKEGWGISTIEAAACGTPVLASDSEGLRDAVRHGETGFLVPHTDVQAWAARMTELLTDADLRARLGAASHQWARQFDWDVEAEKMRRIIEEVVAQSPPSDRGG